MVVEVMIMDMIEIDCFGDSWYLVDIVQKIVQIQVIVDVVFIIFEVGYIYWIKMYQCSLQVNIGFGQLVVGQVMMLV